MFGPLVSTRLRTVLSHIWACVDNGILLADLSEVRKRLIFQALPRLVYMRTQEMYECKHLFSTFLNGL